MNDWGFSRCVAHLFRWRILRHPETQLFRQTLNNQKNHHQPPSLTTESDSTQMMTKSASRCLYGFISAIQTPLVAQSFDKTQVDIPRTSEDNQFVACATDQNPLSPPSYQRVLTNHGSSAALCYWFAASFCASVFVDRAANLLRSY